MKTDDCIFVAVDPGFDSIKVAINNGLFMKFPKEVADITGIDHDLFLGKKNSTYIKAHIIPGKEHLVGEYAATYLSETGKTSNGIEESERLNDTFETFKLVDKRISILSAIGKALIKYAQRYKDERLVDITKREEGGYNVKLINDTKLYIAIALPHNAMEQFDYIKSWLNDTQKFSLETDEGEYFFELDTHRSTVGSQVIAALYGTLTDDDGKLIEDEKSELLSSKRLPAVVLDGGYLTLGIAHFTSVKLVDDSDSNLTYAMKNIYENVAEILKERTGRNDITSVTVKQAMRKDEKVISYVDKDGNGKLEDVEKIVKEETRAVCVKMVDELKLKYNNLQDLRSVVITGGTGIVYYEHIKDLLSKISFIKVILTDYAFYDEKITPDFAIVIGMYKSLKEAVSQARSKKG